MVLGLPVVAMATVPATAFADPAADAAAAQELADRYAPIVMLKDQEEECDTSGEPFAPMAVDVVLDNRQIALRQVGNGDPTVMRAPAASDLFELGEGFYLDFPGDSLQPGCLYERDFNRYAALQPAAVYAHVAQQADRPDLLAVQYWLYWYYNDWNNKHESDWEFIQILFPASSVEEALEVEPLGVGYAQHTGGEQADWDSDKLEREGTHPVVYSSARSHASYFGAALYMGRSGAEGFGCDNTDAPSTRVEPDVVLLPDTVDDPTDPFAWLAFDGRWGERHSDPNNGPTGPAGKARWTEPVDWYEGLRDSAFVVPTGDSQATQVIDAFCGVVEWGSVKFIEYQSSPVRILLSILVVALLARFLIRRTSWKRVEPVPVVRRRRAGEIARASLTLYGRHPLTFAAIGVLNIPLVLVASVIAGLIRHAPLVGNDVLTGSEDGDGATRFVMSALISGLTSAGAFVVAASAVAWIVGQAATGGRVTAIAAIRAVWTRARDLAFGFARAAVIVLVLGITVIGIPIAICQLVRYQFMAPVTMLEGVDASAIARSKLVARAKAVVAHGGLCQRRVHRPRRDRLDGGTRPARRLHRPAAVDAVADRHHVQRVGHATRRDRGDAALRRRRRRALRSGRR